MSENIEEKADYLLQKHWDFRKDKGNLNKLSREKLITLIEIYAIDRKVKIRQSDKYIELLSQSRESNKRLYKNLKSTMILYAITTLAFIAFVIWGHLL